ncbi:hypothetical protein Tco_0291525 [Tanacetum coccineum]
MTVSQMNEKELIPTPIGHGMAILLITENLTKPPRKTLSHYHSWTKCSKDYRKQYYCFLDASRALKSCCKTSSRLENPTKTSSNKEINEAFSSETLDLLILKRESTPCWQILQITMRKFVIKGNDIPDKKIQFFRISKQYFWDELPFLFKNCADQVIDVGVSGQEA